MYWIKLIIGLAGGYLLGSLNAAIIVGHLVRGIDIRDVGNNNPGTANVGRAIGKGWAAVVFFADVAKTIVPMFLASRYLFPDYTSVHILSICGIGMAAVLGHCKPLYFGFRGGGGLATTLGTLSFFIPLELFISMITGFIIVRVFVTESEFRLGRWTSGMIILINPFITLLITAVVHVEISGRYRFGGQPLPVIVGVFAITLFAMLTNARQYFGYIGRFFTGKQI